MGNQPNQPMSKPKRGSFSNQFHSMMRMVHGSSEKTHASSYAESESDRTIKAVKSSPAMTRKTPKEETLPKPPSKGLTQFAPKPPDGPPPSKLASLPQTPSNLKTVTTTFSHEADPPPPPRRTSTRTYEAWYNKNYLTIAHLGRMNGSMICPTCRENIAPSEDKRKIEKFVLCKHCNVNWPLVVARMIPKSPGAERWVRDVDTEGRLCWSRLLRGSEEESLRKILVSCQSLETEEVKARLLALDSPFDESMGYEDLAMQLAIVTAWSGKEFDHVAFCRRFAANGLLEWQPVADNNLDVPPDFKNIVINATEIAKLREEATLPQRISWFKEKVLKLRSTAIGENSAPLTIRVRRDSF